MYIYVCVNGRQQNIKGVTGGRASQPSPSTLLGALREIATQLTLP